MTLRFVALWTHFRSQWRKRVWLFLCRCGVFAPLILADVYLNSQGDERNTHPATQTHTHTHFVRSHTASGTTRIARTAEKSTKIHLIDDCLKKRYLIFGMYSFPSRIWRTVLYVFRPHVFHHDAFFSLWPIRLHVYKCLCDSKCAHFLGPIQLAVFLGVQA